MALRHALELDHSPSRSFLGTCPCKSCIRANPTGETAIGAFKRGLRESSL